MTDQPEQTTSQVSPMRVLTLSHNRPASSQLIPPHGCLRALVKNLCKHTVRSRNWQVPINAGRMK